MGDKDSERSVDSSGGDLEISMDGFIASKDDVHQSEEARTAGGTQDHQEGVSSEGVHQSSFCQSVHPFPRDSFYAGQMDVRVTSFFLDAECGRHNKDLMFDF